MASFAITVRLTYYLITGIMYDGHYTRPGAAACSWNFALETRILLPDGSIVVCEDRGMLGSTGWVDVWNRPDLAWYGPYAEVEVLD